MGGSAGSSSSSSNSTGFEDLSSTYTPNPQAMAAYNQTLNMAENLAQQPYQPYTGQMLAGFTPDQMAAFQGVRNMQGYMQPYINQAGASEMAALGYSNPANYNAQSLQQYYNPYQQSVIQSTQNLMNQQNAMQQQQLLGQANTQAGGAAFNDRTGIAQAALAGQQALANNQTLANLEQQGYQQAQQEYNQQQQQAIAANQAAAYGLGQIGQMGQQGTLQELQALLGTGGQMQNLAQQQLSGAYQQWLNSQAWPYQQTAFLADIAAGIGPSMGGTTNTVGFGGNQGQTQSSQSSMSGSLGGIMSMLPSMFALSTGGRVGRAAGGSSAASAPSTAAAGAGAQSYQDPLAPVDPTQESNAGFGNIGYTPASYLNPRLATGIATSLDPQTLNQMAESRWLSNKYEPAQQQGYAEGGRVGMAAGGNPNILPNLQDIYSNPLFSGFGALIDNKTMPYAGTPLPQIHGHPSPIPSTPSMGFIPHGPAHPPSGGGGGGGGGGEGGGGGKPKKAPDKNTNQPLDDSASGSGDQGGDSGAGIVSSPDAPAMSLVGPSTDTPSGASVGYTPDTVGDTGIAALPSSPDIPLMAGMDFGGMDFGGFAHGGRVGYDGGGSAPAGGGGGLGNLGVYSPNTPSALIESGNLASSAPDILGTPAKGTSFNDLANEWLSSHVIGADPTPESLGFPSMAKDTNPVQPRVEVPSPEMIQTGGMTNLGLGINPGVAAAMGGADPTAALLLTFNQPGGAQAGAPFGGASAGQLQAQRDAALSTPQPAAGYAEGNLDYGRMTPSGLFGMTPVGYYTQPLYAKGGRVGKQGGGRLSIQDAVNLVRQAGGSAQEAAYLASVMKPESGGNPYSYNPNYRTGDKSYGLWQINMLGKMGPERLKQFGIANNNQLFDPLTNAKAALSLLRGPGGIKNWSTWKRGQAAPYLETARAAAANAGPRQFAGVASPASFGQNARALGLLGRGPVALQYSHLDPINKGPSPAAFTAPSAAPNMGASARSLGIVGGNPVADAYRAPLGSAIGRPQVAPSPSMQFAPSLTPNAPITSQVADNSKYIATPPAARRLLSFADLNPVSSAAAAEGQSGAWDQGIPRIDKGPKASGYVPPDQGPVAPGVSPAPAPADRVVHHIDDLDIPARAAPLPPQRPEDLQTGVPLPPRRPAEFSGAQQQEEPGFFDELGNALGGFFDDVGKGLGSIFDGGEAPAPAQTVASNAPNSHQQAGDNDDAGYFEGFDLGDLENMFDGKASGGTVRHGYASDGSVDEEDQQDPTAEPEAQDDPFAFTGEQDQESSGDDFGSMQASTRAPGLGGVEAPQKGEGSGGLGGIFDAIGKGLGELFGIEPAEASEAGARPTGRAPEVTSDIRGRILGIPSAGRSSASERMSLDDQLMADHRKLVNAVLTAPNTLSRQSAAAALRANEFEITQRRLQKQQEMMYDYRRNAAQEKADLAAKAAQEKAELAAKKESAKNHPLGEDVDWTAHRDEFLQTLPPGYAEDIKAIAEGRKAMPKYRGSEEIRRAVTQYDPDYSDQRKATRDEFNSSLISKPGGQITSLTTSINHAGQLLEDTDRLNNYANPLLNKIIRGGKSFWNDDPAAAQWRTTRNALVNEVERYFKGGAPADAAIKRELQDLNEASNPESITRHLYRLTELLNGKRVGLQHKWSQSFGDAPVDNEQYTSLAPEAEKSLAAITSRYEKYEHPQAQKQVKAPAASAETSQPAQALPSERVAGKTTFTNPNGVTFVWNGSGWEKQ